MEYLRIDPLIDSHPDCVEAGWRGVQVFKLLLCVCAARDKKGRLSSKYLSTKWLAEQWRLGPGMVADTPDGFIAEGIKDCVRADLASWDGPDLILNGWDKFYKPAKSGAERTKEWRDKQASRSDDGDGGDDCRHGDDTPHTPHTPHTPLKEDLSPNAARSEPPPGLTSSGEGDSAAPDDESRSVRDEVEAQIDGILAHYVEAMDSQGHRKKPGEKERRIVRARLRERISVTEQKEAIDGLTWSDWHMGRDEKTHGTAYTSIKYCLGSADKVEEFRAKGKAAEAMAQEREQRKVRL